MNNVSYRSFNRLTELNESHVRATRVLEGDYQMRLTELEKEKHLALEEKELYFASQLTQERNNYQTSLVTFNLATIVRVKSTRCYFVGGNEFAKKSPG